MHIRAFVPKKDLFSVFELWRVTLQQKWPLSQALFKRQLPSSGESRNSHRFIAERQGRLLGFIAGQASGGPQPDASISLVMVAPEYQRQGIGAALLAHLVNELQQAGAASGQLGAGCRPLFWHGIPVNSASGLAFFRKEGWELDESSYDMVMDLSNFSLPSTGRSDVSHIGVEIRLAQERHIASLLQFEQSEFPEWLEYFEEAVQARGMTNVVVALQDDQVIGSVLLSHFPDCPGAHWRLMLGADMGALGTLGVREDKRGQGIGLALAAVASRLLKERGVRNCFVHWTGLVDWYGKLGYSVWCEYKMARKRL